MSVKKIEPFNSASAMQRASKYTESINKDECNPQTSPLCSALGKHASLLNFAKKLGHEIFTVQNAFTGLF